MKTGALYKNLKTEKQFFYTKINNVKISIGIKYKYTV